MWILKMLWTFIKALFRRPPELTNEAKQRMLDNIKKKAFENQHKKGRH